jgi:hypothetical protein
MAAVLHLYEIAAPVSTASCEHRSALNPRFAMALWSRLKQELDRAGHVAQEAIDEGRVRLDAFRARQLANKAAQTLGYAVYRARQHGRELDPDTYARLSSALAGHEAEAARLEERLETLVRARRGGRSTTRPARGGPARESPADEPQAPPT